MSGDIARGEERRDQEGSLGRDLLGEEAARLARP